jgi:hypothetical protein
VNASPGRRSGVLALAFATAFLVLFLAPPFLPYRFDPYPLINWADVVDLITPLVLIPLYWFLLADSEAPLGAGWVVAFLILGAAWVDAHGIHLAANAIGHLLKAQPGPALDLTEFWDEKFGHYLWHSAALGLSGLIFLRTARSGTTARTGPTWTGIVAALIYGFALFLIADEGGTALLMIPFAIALTAAAWIVRRRLLSSPTLAMFGLGYAFALLLFAIWFAYWGGTLPQFSEIGLIK